MPDFHQELRQEIFWAQPGSTSNSSRNAWISPREHSLADAKQDLLGRRESEKLLRLAKIWEASLDLFDGDEARTRAWLVAPAFGLGNTAPIDYTRTEFGSREVRALIGRISSGVFS